MKKILFLLLLFVVSVLSVSAQLKNYFIAEDEISIVLPNREADKSSHTIAIKRTFANADEERLLNIAEAVYPEPTLIGKNCEARESAIMPKNTKNRWWYSSFDGTLQAFAITKGAVAYYTMLSEAHRDNDANIVKGIKMSKTAFTYQTAIKFQESFAVEKETFKNVYVATMSLNWYQYCGSLCAMGFSKKRTVVLDKTGKILFVEGDGAPPVMVS